MRSLLVALFALGLAGIPRSSAQEDSLPRSSVEVSNGKFLGGTRSIIVPTVFLNLSIRGDAYLGNPSEASSGHLHGKYAVRDLEKTFAQDLARRLQEDLVTRLREAGFTVQSYDDIKHDPEVERIGLQGPDPELGMPVVGDLGGRIEYVRAVPSDGQQFEPAPPGVHWAFRGEAAYRGASVIVPELWITAPQVFGERASNRQRANAELNLISGMSLTRAFAWFINPSGDGGRIRTTQPWRNVSEQVGTFVQAGSASARGNDSALKQTQALWVMTLDRLVYAEAVLKAGRAFNGLIVEVVKQENGRP